MHLDSLWLLLQLQKIFCSRLFKQTHFIFIFLFVLRFYLFTFRERGREGEWKGETHQCVRDTWISCLLGTPNWEPGPQHRPALWVGIELAAFQPALNPLSHTSQGHFIFIKLIIIAHSLRHIYIDEHSFYICVYIYIYNMCV